MKRYIYILTMASLTLYSCSREALDTDSAQCTRLRADMPSDTRIQLQGGTTTVWNAGDKVSVFHGSSGNECWSYAGSDLARSGDLEYKGKVNFGTDEVFAVYPWADSLKMDGRTVSAISLPARRAFRENSFSDAVLASHSTDSTLLFSYTHSFIKLNVRGYGSLKSVVLRARGGESIAGTAAVDFNGAAPVLKMAEDRQACDSIVIRNDDLSALVNCNGSAVPTFIAVPSGTYSDGFELTALDGTGETHKAWYTGLLTLGCGEFAQMDVTITTKREITVDFTSEPFTEDLPTGGFKVGDSRNDHTYQTKGTPSYPFFLHAEYNESGFGFYRNSSKGLVIGRIGAYITFPRLSNHVLYRVVYTAGSSAGTPYLAATESGEVPGDSCKVSTKTGTTVAGQDYEILSNRDCPDKNYHIVVSSGNLCILKMTLYYKRVK